MKRTALKTLIGGIVTVGTLMFLIPLVDLQHIRTAFLAMDPRWVMFGFLAYAGAYVARALRFQILLPGYRVSFLSLLRVTMIHGAAVRILPNPLGELAFLGGTKSLGVRYSSSISALVVCRALDFATIALLLFVGALLSVSSAGTAVSVTAFIGGGIALASGGIIIISSFYQEPLIRFLNYVQKRFPVRGTLIAKKGMQLITALRFLREERVYIKAIQSSLFIWSLMFIAYWAFFHAAGNTLSLVVLVVAGTIQILANTIPSIGGIGTMESGWLAGFSVSGITPAEVLSGAIFVDIATLVGTIIFGTVGLLFLWCTRPTFQSAQLRLWKLTKKGVLVLGVIGLVGGALFFFQQKQPLSSPTLPALPALPASQPQFVEVYPEAAIEAIWTSYRMKIQKDGRTIDRDRDYLTTSEGQSYSLLRAVWMDDKETFDRVLKWTNNNLAKRPQDSLFAWLWGKNSDEKWDIIYERDGINTASDADQDIALALIFAGKRWNQDHYIRQAQEILGDIWNTEVVVVEGKPYLTAGNWALGEERPTLNPSYFSFAAYPIFAEVDPGHPWLLLKDSAYEALSAATHNSLAGKTSADIPPDWVSVNLVTGDVESSLHDDKTTDFSDDAFRVLWRVALDWKWHQDPRAYAYLKEMDFFEREWHDQRKVSGRYAHDGTVVASAESNSVYAVIASSFASVQPEFSREVFNTKVAPLYSPDTEDLIDGLGYYALNWVWFGMALYTNNTPNLFLVD